MKVIIAAAGTAGHINPGLSIANKIKEKNKDAEIIFIGTNRGLENDLVPRSGYKLKTIEAYGFSKSISITNFKNIIKTMKGFSQAKKIVEEFKPDIVIGTGGYICGAVITAGHKNKIPTLLHESNAYPGLAIRMLSKKVDTILVGFEEAKEKLSRARNVVVTGTPTKMKGIKLTEEQKVHMRLSLNLKDNMPIVLAFGGSQGARVINNALIDIIKNKKYSNFQIIWAAGPEQYKIIKGKLEHENINIDNIDGVKIVPYIYNMEEVMNLADVIVSRSGAMTLTEIALARKTCNIYPTTKYVC
ncbi:MAG: UDP-N-acetylglucosamine--N-acetylmuramyl-(pentapeptide) pyrophosphoryl-undecaprenol N-acetylglucosamine transferase [Clostridia bacterium]|nr:UDP-N-acetylglucosamine--N-acetylmuramyl-(pentapeptide) pyrophosphoryl-undecaprenol N-acetylglucosamine transferase [Clostridia bacterium]